MRGATFDGLDEKTLRNNVIAVGNDVFVDNRTLNIPHSIVSPSILFDEGGSEARREDAEQVAGISRADGGGEQVNRVAAPQLRP